MGMGEVLREFGVKVSLNFDGKKVDEAERKIKKFSSEMKTFALEVAGVSAGLFATGKAFTGNARSLQDQSDALNITTKEMQEYEYAAGVAADATREDLVGSLGALGDTLDKARAGVPEARQALFNMANAAGKGGELLTKLQDPMFKVTDAAKLLSEGISKMSVSNPLAARRMTELAFGSDKLYNLWRQGPDAISKLNKEADKNFVLNEKMVRSGKEMDVQLSKLWFAFRKMGYEIGFNVMKHLMPMVHQFEKWFNANKKLISSGINGFLDTLADVLQGVFEAGVGVLNFLQPLIKALGGAGQVAKDLVYAFIALKGISLAGSFLGMSVGIGKFVATLLGVGPMFSRIVTGIGAITGTITSFLGGLTAVIAAGYAGYKLGQMLNEYIDSKTGGQGIGGKIYDLLHPDETPEAITSKLPSPSKKLNAISGEPPYSQVAPSGAFAGMGAPMSSTPSQEFNIVNNLTVTTPKDASVAQTAAAARKAQMDAHSQALRKAKADSARSRQY